MQLLCKRDSLLLDDDIVALQVWCSSMMKVSGPGSACFF